MVFSHVVGKNAEYRLRDWFRAREGWKAERNPLSGASEQIEEELGKHDVRAWNDDLRIFLQLENKKTMIKKKNKDGQDDDTIVIQKEWLDKINFDNDEFLVFSFNRCKQHFAYMPKEVAEPVISKLNLKKSELFEAKGESGYGFKREWLEGKEDLIFISDFIEKTWYAMDLGVYIGAREKYKIATQSTSFSEQIKTVTSVEDLNKIKEEKSKNWKTRDWRIYYSKLERLENGDTAYNPAFIKEGQWWMSEDKKFDWNENTIKSIMNKTQDFIDGNLEENSEGDNVWVNNKDIEKLEKDIKKILGLDKKNDNKSGK